MKINTHLTSSGNYEKPFKKSKMAQFSISFRAPDLWNALIKETNLKTDTS